MTDHSPVTSHLPPCQSNFIPLENARPACPAKLIPAENLLFRDSRPLAAMTNLSIATQQTFTATGVTALAVIFLGSSIVLILGSDPLSPDRESPRHRKPPM